MSKEVENLHAQMKAKDVANEKLALENAKLCSEIAKLNAIRKIVYKCRYCEFSSTEKNETFNHQINFHSEKFKTKWLVW